MNPTHFKRIGIFAVTVLLVLGMSWLYFDVTGAQEYERVIALLKERGDLTSWEELHARIDATEHGEMDKKVVAFFFGLKEDLFAKPYSVGSVEIFDAKMKTDIDRVWGQWSPEVERVVGLACEENREFLMEAVGIAALPKANVHTWLDTARADTMQAFKTPEIACIRGVSNLLLLQAMLHVKTGNPDEALECVSDSLRFANHMGGRGFLLGEMLVNVIRGQALHTLQKITSEADFSNEAIAGMDFSLQASVQRQNYTRSIEMERLVVLNILASFVDSSKGETLGIEAFQLMYNRALRGFSLRCGLEAIGFLNRYVEATRRPFLEAHALLESIDQEMDDSEDSQATLTLMMLPVFSRTHAQVEKISARLHQARIALALMRFKRDEGAYPDSLQALAHAYLDTLPDDPFSGSSFRYQKLDKGYVLYSIGENFQDDGPDNESPQSVWRMTR
jgi:hypothetical protein